MVTVKKVKEILDKNRCEITRRGMKAIKRDLKKLRPCPCNICDNLERGKP